MFFRSILSNESSECRAIVKMSYFRCKIIYLILVEEAATEREGEKNEKCNDTNRPFPFAWKLNTLNKLKIDVKRAREAKPIQLPKKLNLCEKYRKILWGFRWRMRIEEPIHFCYQFVCHCWTHTVRCPCTKSDVDTAGYLNTEIFATLGQFAASYSIFGGCRVRCTNRTIYIFPLFSSHTLFCPDSFTIM